jgi:hypothetical protein
MFFNRQASRTVLLVGHAIDTAPVHMRTVRDVMAILEPSQNRVNNSRAFSHLVKLRVDTVHEPPRYCIAASHRHGSVTAMVRGGAP